MESRPGGTWVEPAAAGVSGRPDAGRDDTALVVLSRPAGAAVEGSSPLTAWSSREGGTVFDGGDVVWRVDPDGLFGLGDGPLGDDPFGGEL